jgi:butyryl-CoA dehydrogenase
LLVKSVLTGMACIPMLIGKGEAMDLSLSDEQVMFRDMAREFAQRYIAPVAKDNDDNEHFPQEVIAEMIPLGLLGAIVPQEYGGLGLDHICYAMIVEEIARACQSVAVAVFCAHSVVGEVLAQWGDEEQKQIYLPPMCKGEVFSCYALSEPEAGSDLSSLQTSAVLHGEQWVLNGAKASVVNGGISHLALVFARSDGGIGAFLVPWGTPGFSSIDIHSKKGLRACNIADLLFQDCPLPQRNLFGEGDDIALSTLHCAHFSLAATYIGVAQACLDVSINYAQERQQFGKPIGSFDMVQGMIAEMAVGVQAARLLLYQTGFLKDQGLSFAKELSMAKYYASEVAMRAVSAAIQVHGGYGYTKEYPVERYFRNVVMSAICEGTPLMHKLSAARYALELGG